MGGILSRTPPERIIEGPRRRLLATILERPGLSLLELKDAVGFPGFGKLLHHLAVLELTGHVRSVRNGRYRRYYAAAVVTDAEARADAATKNPHTNRVWQAVLRSPGADQATLAVLVGAGCRQTTGYHLDRLVAAGAIRSKRDGRSTRYWPVEVTA